MAQGSATEIVTGGIVLAAAVGFVVYAVNAASLGGGGSDTYDITASFRSAEGISVGTDVRMAGVKVGSVTGLDLNNETFRADATFAIQSGLELPDDTSVAVASEGLLGGSFIELVPGGSPFTLEEGGEIIDTQSSVSLITLLLRFVTGSDE